MAFSEGAVDNFGPDFGKFGKKSQKPYKKLFKKISSEDFYRQYFGPYQRQLRLQNVMAQRGVNRALGVSNVGAASSQALAQRTLTSQYPQLRQQAEIEQIRRMNLARDPWFLARQKMLQFWLAKQGLGLQSEIAAAQLAAQGGGGGIFGGFF